MKTSSTAVVAILLGTFISSSAALARNPLTISGSAITNGVDAGTTVGAGELRIKGRGVGTVKLTCGILGQLKAANVDGSLSFQHTVACSDHSLFILQTTTSISPRGPCPSNEQLIVGTFEETSLLFGVDGPYQGSTGALRIVGTINCQFIDMEIAGEMNRP